MANNKEKMLAVHDLRISFRTNAGKVQAVRGINFDLYKGETLAIVGESGSGKSVTSKAILGIQAGNAINEGGEILYNGMDLLKIGEDDFYRLRGDKIAMIFQDPLSSLNPIMRIGKQLTEAMMLKGKARQKASRKSFQNQTRLLAEYMIDAQPQNEASIHQNIETFRKLETEAVSREKKYNDALDCAQEALSECENILFLIDKNAWKDSSEVRKVREFSLRTVNPWVVPESEASALRQEVDGMTSEVSPARRSGDYTALKKHLSSIRDILRDAVNKPKPDFLRIAWKETGHNGSLDADLMDDFRSDAVAAVRHVDEKFLALREKAIEKLKKGLDTLNQHGVEGLIPELDEMTKAVQASIDPIDVVKDSMALTFTGSIRDFARDYQIGLRTNDRKEKKYEREVRVSEKRAAKGKDWTVPAPTTIDLDRTEENMRRVIERLIEHYENRNRVEPLEDKADKANRIIASIEQSASGTVARITKWAAKNRALKLMEEVGIPEPRKRYRQYPFEFSGGMRQRIVIAIALAADPDILICDEPTTALDVTIQAQILELINQLKEKRHLSIIFITHDLGVVANMADRIAVMYAGKIVEYGTAEDVFYDPVHPYTWALLSSMPDLDTKEKLEAIPGTPPNMIYPPRGDAFAQRNRYAMEIDFEEEPPVFSVSDTHWAATWLLHPDAPKVERPRSITERIEKMKARREASDRV